MARQKKQTAEDVKKPRTSALGLLSLIFGAAGALRLTALVLSEVYKTQPPVASILLGALGGLLGALSLYLIQRSAGQLTGKIYALSGTALSVIVLVVAGVVFFSTQST